MVEETCLDDDPEEGLLIPADDATTLPTRGVVGYGGPRLVGTIGIGGMGWSRPAPSGRHSVSLVII